jgi:glucosamine 6-phosphate synthetase-like amidotransferase/phosphosugar isomerase protein
VTDENAHPHVDQSGKLVLIHNGVIENFQFLQDQLLKQNHQFRTEMDTEVLAHLIRHIFKARKVRVIAIASQGRKEIAQLADDVIYILKCPDFVFPILTVLHNKLV